MCAINSRLRDERGVGVVAALLIILVLALLGTVMVGLTVKEMDAGGRHVQSEQALMAAEAALSYAKKQFAANAAWTGLPEPGRAIGRGHFIVVVNTTDADGTTVTSPMKVLHAVGLVGGARREIVVRATPGGGGSTVTLYARAQGNALSFNAQHSFANIPLMVDANGTNLTYASGEWQHQQQVIVGSWQAGSVSGAISKVEILLNGYVTSALNDDYTTVAFYRNDALSGSTTTITPATLNTRLTSASISQGPWIVDVTSARTWALTDFSGNLELLTSCVKTASDDGSTLQIDAVALRITTSGGAATFDTQREVIS